MRQGTATTLAAAATSLDFARFRVRFAHLDLSRAALRDVKRSAIKLLERILRPGDRAFVISVDGNVRLWADLSETSSDVRTQLAGTPGGLFGEPCAKRWSGVPGMRPTSACGSSPLWDAIYDAARLRLRAITGNKALLILTDGFDSGSTHTWHQTADAVTTADASLYAVQYRSGFGRNFAPDLYRLVADAGGTTVSPPDDQSPGGKYNPIVSRIETDLRHRYVLGFRPERLSGKVRHEIRVEVTRPDLTVRARKTYFQHIFGNNSRIRSLCDALTISRVKKARVDHSGNFAR
jgi:VWFA-related protein